MDDVVTLVVGDFGKSFGCEQESTTFFADDLSVVFNLERFGLLTRHLKRADFFDVEKYPNASFVSTKIELRRGPKGATHQVSGDLTIHGVTRPVNFPARITLRRDAVSHDRTLTISQTSFGMPDAAQKTQDDVPITVSVNATRS
ncbi:MAG: YceI family protein [Gemmataceae bacterium]